MLVVLRCHSRKGVPIKDKEIKEIESYANDLKLQKLQETSEILIQVKVVRLRESKDHMI